MSIAVGIITCNRINHLKECVKSLQNNKISGDVDLYISVDCPPSDKYLDGYNNVVAYLKDGIEGFNSVSVFYQENNLGHEKNCYWLEDKIFEKYDYFIYSEDDNVFSSNFLEYMIKSIQENNNDDCYAACGHLYPVDFAYGNNTVVRMYNDFDAWGYAIWKDKTLKARKYILSEDFIKASKDYKLMYKLFKMNKRLFCYYVDNLYKRVKVMKSECGATRVFDITLAIYSIFTDKYNVVPVINKSRNNGWDGSGINCPKGSDEHVWANQEIDNCETFDYVYSLDEDNRGHNIKVMHDYHMESVLHVTRRVIELILYNLRNR